ncbi:retrotransposon polyprotein, putative [Aspergillus lentulus]|nr:retrotransposon polyprotein, putative [Aspergillus lentulus]
MEGSLSECTSVLARRSAQEDTFDAGRDADHLKFRFAKEHDLPLRVYVQRKVMLLQGANITDEQQIVSLV